MVAQQLTDRWRDQPIQLRRRIAPPQLVQDRDGVNDVADGGQFDQQNFAEITVAQIGRGRVQKRLLSRDNSVCGAARLVALTRVPARFFPARA